MSTAMSVAAAASADSRVVVVLSDLPFVSAKLRHFCGKISNPIAEKWAAANHAMVTAEFAPISHAYTKSAQPWFAADDPACMRLKEKYGMGRLSIKKQITHNWNVYSLCSVSWSIESGSCFRMSHGWKEVEIEQPWRVLNMFDPRIAEHVDKFLICQGMIIVIDAHEMFKVLKMLAEK